MISLLLRHSCAALIALGLAGYASGIETTGANAPVGAALDLQNSAAALNYRTLSQWPNGFVGEVTLTNSSSQPIELWSVEVDLDAKVSSSWGARLLDTTSGKLVFGYESWNKVVAPGQTTRFGFLSSTPLPAGSVPNLALRDVNDDIAEADSAWLQFVNQQQGIALQQSWGELMAFTFTRFESLTPARTGFDFIEKDPAERYITRRFERVHLRTLDGLVIKGVFLPVPRAKGTVIMLHGHGNTYFETLPLAQLLAERGYQVLTYNSREWNFYHDPENYIDDLRNDASDISAAVRYLHSRYDVDAQRIGVMGYSYGATKALLAAPTLSALRVVIVEGANAQIPTLNPAISWESVKDDFSARYAAHLHIAPNEITVNTGQIALISPRAVLVIHGQNDQDVPLAEGQELFAAAGQPKSLLILPQSGHVDALTTPDRELYLSRITAFLDQYLAPLPH